MHTIIRFLHKGSAAAWHCTDGTMLCCARSSVKESMYYTEGMHTCTSSCVYNNILSSVDIYKISQKVEP